MSEWLTPYECVESEVVRLRQALVDRALAMEAKGIHREEIRRQLGVPSGWCWRNLPAGEAKGRPGRKPLPVPHWVPDHLHEGYRLRTSRGGETAAARWARKMKREAA